MLYIYLGHTKNEIFNPSIYFDTSFESKWINTQYAKRCIKEIDKSEVIKDRYIESPYLGAISPTELSGGVKTLILLESETEDLMFNISACGDNCAKFILELSEEKDIYCTLHHPMKFPEPYKITILNSNIIIENHLQMIDQYYNFLIDEDEIRETWEKVFKIEY